jgi:arylsulfatase A-like enzyme
MVHSADESVGRLLATLDETGLADNTIVIFYSDNGGFGPATSMAPLRGSKGMLYEGGIRVPLIVRWPGRVRAGATQATPVIGTDFYPTLIEIAGGELPGSEQVLDGTSFVPLLVSEGEWVPRPLFWHFPAYLQRDASVEPGQPFRTTPASAIRDGEFKLIWYFEDSRAELYDLANDLSETNDLAATVPEKTADLQAQLLAWWAETDAFLPTERTGR